MCLGSPASQILMNCSPNASLPHSFTAETVFSFKKQMTEKSADNSKKLQLNKYLCDCLGRLN